jgi:hypothetical protein
MIKALNQQKSRFLLIFLLINGRIQIQNAAQGKSEYPDFLCGMKKRRILRIRRVPPVRREKQHTLFGEIDIPVVLLAYSLYTLYY